MISQVHFIKTMTLSKAAVIRITATILKSMVGTINGVALEEG